MTPNSRPWVKMYDPGVPATLEPYPHHSLQQLLRDAAAKNPDAPALISSAHLPVAGRLKATLSYRQLEAYSDALAVALIDLGVKKGDRVALILPNTAQFVIAFFAILKAGAVVCATNPTYPGPKLQHQLADSGATTAIVLSLYYNTLKSVQGRTAVKNVIVTSIKDYLPVAAAALFTAIREKKDGHRIVKADGDHDFLDLVKRYEARKPEVEVNGEDPAIFQYTGGTTGVPKAAIGTHNALVANTLQSRAFLGETGKEVYLAAIPLFHVFGLVAVLNMAISLGASMIMVPNPRDITEILQVIDAYQPTIFMGVPAMYNAINNHPDVATGRYNLRSIRCCVSGSAPLSPTTKRTFEELTGAKLSEGYGMSETPTAACVNPLYGENRVGSIGIPLPDTDLRIVSLQDGVTEMPLGEIGELVVAGPQLMSGYHNMPQETALALRKDADGRTWMYTGDIAKMDADGYFYIVDRKKDMALIGGYNVYPTNVENALMEHPAVQDVGVAAVPHPDKEGQECLKAWVVVKPDHAVSAETLISFAEQRLARYEVPTRVVFIKELPKTMVGKTLRRELQIMDAVERAKDAQAQTAQPA